MTDGLPTFREGFAIAPQLTARALNSIVAAIRRNRITPGPNQLLDQSNGGTQVWDRRRRTSLATPAPFTILALSETSVTFQPGTINGLPAPITFTGVPMTGTQYLTLDTTWASGAVTAAVWAVSTTPPPGSAVTQGTPPTTLSILIHVIKDGVPFRVIGLGSLQVTPYESFRTDKTPPLVLGERPWISWYGYSVAATA